MGVWSCIVAKHYGSMVMYEDTMGVWSCIVAKHYGSMVMYEDTMGVWSCIVAKLSIKYILCNYISGVRK